MASDHRTSSPCGAAAVVVAGHAFGDARPEDEAPSLERGSRVRVEGLVSQPECNGLEGTVKKLLQGDRVWIKLVSILLDGLTTRHTH
jgi:hypothetical protein